MGNMGLGHQKAVAADASSSAAAGGSAMYRDKFAYMISVTDLDRRRLSAVFQVLRSQPDRHEGKYMIIVTDSGISVDHGVRIDPNTASKFDVVADYRKCADVTVQPQDSGRTYQRGFMDK
jgi:hypothetical protein